MQERQTSTGVRCTQRLSTAAVANSFFPAAVEQGVVLYEPCGGLCAGLEMLLSSGISVKQYYYSDTDPEAQQIACHRFRQLQSRFPEQLQPEAFQSALSTFPADIAAVSSQQLAAAVRRHSWPAVGGGRRLALSRPVLSRQGKRYGWQQSAAAVQCCAHRGSLAAVVASLASSLSH